MALQSSSSTIRLAILLPSPDNRQKGSHTNDGIRPLPLGPAPKGDANKVTDWLSFTYQICDGKPNPLAFDSPDNATLSNCFHCHLPQLIPQRFKICPLPDKILSFVTLVLQTTESSIIQWSQRQTKIVTKPGVAGKAFAQKLGSWNCSSLMYPSVSENSSSERFSPLTSLFNGTNQAMFLKSIALPWQERLSALLQAIWLRRFRTISNQAPFTSRTEPSYSHQSMPCFKPWITFHLLQNDKKQLL
mmetsp:Transcript_17988/g.27235  ORF Transcript_17988/g.27235 Transcript_17988/m.27235 type:complete len:245 (-) Transcript_17988:1493-2227(-)